jgi:DNA-binding MarR family transcriptional regulator
MVDRLVERGLLERCPDPADGRGERLSLTDAGREAQQQIGRRHARSVARAVGAELSPDELRDLATIGWKLAGRPAATDASTSHDKELTRT